MDEDIATPREQPPAREDGHWGGAFWDFITTTLANFTGYRVITVFSIYLIGLAFGYLAKQFRAALAAPDVVDDAAHEDNLGETDHQTEEVATGDSTDGSIQPDNRSVRLTGQTAERNGRDTANTADQPDNAPYSANQATAGEKTVHVNKLVKSGHYSPQVLDARNCTINYPESKGEMEEREVPQTGPFAGASRIEIDTMEFAGDFSPFFMSASDCRFNYK